MDEMDQYIQLLRDLSNVLRNINEISVKIKQFDFAISRGFVVNDELSFKSELNSFKELLDSKKNKIRNEIFPAIIACMDATRR